MADNTPNVPGGAMPPKPAEAAKVQPKKETVRITLPPKPTAAPTVKLPSLAPPPAPAATPAPAAAATLAQPAPAGASLAPRPAAAPTSTGRGPATRAPMSRPAPVGARPSGMDSALAIMAGIVGLAAAGMVFFLYTLANIEY